jgi:hypothetical protein
MSQPPFNSQPPASFHPAFDREVYQVVFSVCIFDFIALPVLKFSKVEGQGFKVDSARLAAHSEFIHDMLFQNGGHIGLVREGSVEHPIIVEGCSKETFANFLGWLNHK